MLMSVCMNIVTIEEQPRSDILIARTKNSINKIRNLIGEDRQT